MIAPIADNVLTRACASISQALGLHFPPARSRDLLRGVAAATPALGFKKPEECLARIADGLLTPEQIDVLAAHLTIGETYFFRDAALFHHLEHTLLPHLIAERRARRKQLRLWSAGCCTGEEAYSLAILLHRLIPDLKHWDLSVLGTDINLESLAKAREGCYGPWSFRGSPLLNDPRYFTPGPGKNVVLRKEIRALVHFEYLNLAQCAYPNPDIGTCDIDLLLCRNVLMYFEPGAARDAVGRLAETVAMAGWFAVAPSELALVDHPDLVPVHQHGTILHQRSPRRRPSPACALMTPIEFGAAPVVDAAAAPAALPPRRADVPAPIRPAPDDRLNEAESLYTSGRSDAARNLATSLLESHPGNGGAMRLLARICANGGRLAEADLWCDRAIASDRLDPCAYYLRALVSIEQGRHARAGEALRRALYLAPDFIIAHYTLGALCHTLGDPGAAQRHWRNAVRLLSRSEPEATLPESDGLSAGRLLAIVREQIDGEPAP